MRPAGFVLKMSIRSTIILTVVNMLVGALFSVSRLITAPAPSLVAFFQPGLAFLACTVLPILVFSAVGRVLYMAPVMRVFWSLSSNRSPLPASEDMILRTAKRLYDLPVFMIAWQAIVFTLAYGLPAFISSSWADAAPGKIALVPAMGAAAAVISSFIQTGSDTRILEPVLRAFGRHASVLKDKKVRLGVRFSLNLLCGAVIAFNLLFAVGIFIDSGRAEASPGFTAAAFIAVAVLSLAVVFSFTGRLRRRLLYQRSLLESIMFGGDFYRQRLNVLARDEIDHTSETINRFIDKFKGILETIFSSADSVQAVSGSLDNSLSNASAAIEEMVATIKQITANADTQIHMVNNTRSKLEEMLIGIDGTSIDVIELSNFVQETSSAMHETTASIQTISKNTEQVNALANRLVDISQNGSVSVNDTVNAIREIEKASAQVGNIVGVISEIASQTNLLSLNASIEAAHAGDKGKGFAVVAAEIRKLAEQSHENIGLIEQQIKNMTNKVESGVTLSSAANEAFRKIHEDIKLTTQHINQVTIALQEQNLGTREIMTALEEMVKKTVEVKEIAEDLKRMSEEIHKFMEELYGISSSINDATGEQNKGNKDLLTLISTVKDASRKNLAIVDNLHTIISDYQAQPDPGAHGRSEQAAAV